MTASAERAHAARRTVIEAAVAARTAHIGSSLSIVDVLAVLYTDVLGGDDRFLLSKGHAASALYATLAAAGKLDADEVVSGYCSDGGTFAGHPERGVAGIEMTGGSLGHGPAIAVGTALADRQDDNGKRTFCLVGDGELNEGSVWEAIALAGHLELGNLTLIVDANGLQGLGTTGDVLDLEPLLPKLQAFGWHATEVDGHDHHALCAVLSRTPRRPHAVVARTVKGYGVSSMQNELMSHYKPLDKSELEPVLAELDRLRLGAEAAA
jgi:transketolase